METKLYNVVAMRPALEYAYRRGNRKALDETMAKTLGITDGYFKLYEANRNALYEAVKAFVRVNHNNAADDKAKAEAKTKVMDAWQEMLSCAETEKTERWLIADESDLYDLVSVCQKLARDRNDASMGKDKSFVAMWVWAAEDGKTFSRELEKIIGLGIFKRDMLSDEEYAFLKAERKLLGTIKRCAGSIAECDEKIAKWNEMVTASKSKELKDAVSKAIAELTETKDAMKKASDEATEELTNLRANYQGDHIALVEPAAKISKAKKNGEVKVSTDTTAEPAPKTTPAAIAKASKAAATKADKAAKAAAKADKAATKAAKPATKAVAAVAAN